MVQILIYNQQFTQLCPIILNKPAYSFRGLKSIFISIYLLQGTDFTLSAQNMKGVSIIKRAIKEKKQPVDKIKELEISGQRLSKLTVEMKSALEECKNLQNLIMCECDLISLDNLPNLDKLVQLDISTNSIPDSQVSKLEKYKNLKSLSLADNKITKLQTIRSLSAALVNVQRLECADNEIEELPNYFKAVFAMFPKLVLLDRRDTQGKEVDTGDFDDEEGQEDFDDQEQNYQQSGSQGQEGQQGQDDDEQYQEDEEGEDGQEQDEQGDSDNEKKKGKK